MKIPKSNDKYPVYKEIAWILGILGGVKAVLSAGIFAEISVVITILHY